jgi:hypothetical protein
VDISTANPHAIAPQIFGADGTLHVPSDAPVWAKPFDGMKVPPPSVQDDKLNYQLPIGQVQIGFSVENGHAVVAVTSDNFVLPTDEVAKQMQQQLDQRTQGRSVDSVSVDHSGVHIKFKQ